MNELKFIPKYEFGVWGWSSTLHQNLFELVFTSARKGYPQPDSFARSFGYWFRTNIDTTLKSPFYGPRTWDFTKIITSIYLRLRLGLFFFGWFWISTIPSNDFFFLTPSVFPSLWKIYTTNHFTPVKINIPINIHHKFVRSALFTYLHNKKPFLIME